MLGGNLLDHEVISEEEQDYILLKDYNDFLFY